jgi:hypothetical protein
MTPRRKKLEKRVQVWLQVRLQEQEQVQGTGTNAAGLPGAVQAPAAASRRVTQRACGIPHQSPLCTKKTKATHKDKQS